MKKAICNVYTSAITEYDQSECVKLHTRAAISPLTIEPYWLHENLALAIKETVRKLNMLESAAKNPDRKFTAKVGFPKDAIEKHRPSRG